MIPVSVFRIVNFHRPRRHFPRTVRIPYIFSILIPFHASAPGEGNLDRKIDMTATNRYDTHCRSQSPYTICFCFALLFIRLLFCLMNRCTLHTAADPRFAPERGGFPFSASKSLSSSSHPFFTRLPPVSPFHFRSSKEIRENGMDDMARSEKMNWLETKASLAEK